MCLEIQVQVQVHNYWTMKSSLQLPHFYDVYKGAKRSFNLLTVLLHACYSKVILLKLSVKVISQKANKKNLEAYKEPI